MTSQMIRTNIIRHIHTNGLRWQTSSKSLLANLRKQTGYTFANCKKALELNENNFEKALSWLKNQAQAQGWAQAEKLSVRNTTQGLIALMVEKNHGVLVEINCETDFVARNNTFHGLAETVTKSLLNHAKTIQCTKEIEKTLLSSDVLKSLPAPDGKSLGDHSALMIGTLKENINIKRALCMTIEPNAMLFGSTHPAPIEPIPVSYGKYGVLLALKCDPDDYNKTLGQQLCQHIIGLHPTKIGDTAVDTPVGSMDNETCMIFQEFLFEPSFSVQQVLKDADAKVLDFARFGVGEDIENAQPDVCAEAKPCMI